MSESKSSSPPSSSATKSSLEKLESLRIEHESCKRNSHFLVERADSMIQEQLADHKSAMSERKRQLEKWLKLLEQWLNHLLEHFDRVKRFKKSQEKIMDVAMALEGKITGEGKVTGVTWDIDKTNGELADEVTDVIHRLKSAIEIIANLENIARDEQDRSDEIKRTAEDMSRPSSSLYGCALHPPGMIGKVAGYTSFYDTVMHMRTVNKFWHNEVKLALDKNDELKETTRLIIERIRILRKYGVLDKYVAVNKQYAEIILALPEQYGISTREKLLSALTHDLVSADLMAILRKTTELNANDFEKIMNLNPSQVLKEVRDNIDLAEKDSIDWLNIPLPEGKSTSEKLNYFYKYFDLKIAAAWRLDFIESLDTKTAMQILKHFLARLSDEECIRLISTPVKLKIALLVPQFKSMVQRVIHSYKNKNKDNDLLYEFWSEHQFHKSMKLVEDFVTNHPTLLPDNKKKWLSEARLWR